MSRPRGSCRLRRPGHLRPACGCYGLRQPLRSMPGQRPGTVGRGPPSQSEHRRHGRYPRLVPFGSRLGLRQHRLRGVQGGRRPPCSGCLAVSPASVVLAWRPLHARRAVLHDLDSALSGRLRRGRCACPSPPLASRAHSSGALAAPPAVTHLPRAPPFRLTPSSRRGEALWERVEAGSGSLGAASSESAAGSGRLRACGSSCGC